MLRLRDFKQCILSVHHVEIANGAILRGQGFGLPAQLNWSLTVLHLMKVSLVHLLLLRTEALPEFHG